MRVRALDASGDRKFGRSLQDFYIDQPEGVAQCARTRLGFWYGEWFLDRTDGTPWMTKVLGKYTGAIRDAVVRARVLGTPGANRIITYSSSFTTRSRYWTANIQLDTIYGTTRTFALDELAIGKFMPQFVRNEDGTIVYDEAGRPELTNTGLRTT
jgi:hypothetical protein